MKKNEINQSSQEQAVAAWIDYLNQIRLNNLVETLNKQDINLGEAMSVLDETLKTVHNDILATNRGGDDGSHGFIAEIAEWGIENARQRIDGKADSIEWVDNNGPTDLIRTVIKNGELAKENIQQKFYHSGDGLSLDAIERHFEKYPDYLNNNGKYQIPKDQYDKIMEYVNIPEEKANKMPTSDGSFSLKQWKRVQDFKNNSAIGIDNIEPAETTYREVQKGKIDETIAEKKTEIREADSKNREEAYHRSLPSLKEYAKATAVATLVECASAFVSELSHKIRLRKGIKNLKKEDWVDIAAKSGYGAIKGGVRGSVTYGLSNYTATPAFMASSIVTAAFGIAEKVHEFNQGDIDEVTMIEESELLCLDTVMSAISSLVGQYFIPVPIIGAIIGNTVGMFVYGNAKNALFRKQQELFDGYTDSVNMMVQDLNKEFIAVFNKVSAEINTYMALCEQAFSVDVNEAFEGSIKIARFIGVDEKEILDSEEKIINYFTE